MHTIDGRRRYILVAFTHFMRGHYFSLEYGLQRGHAITVPVILSYKI